MSDMLKTGEYITFDSAKDIIVCALTSYHEELGALAAEILNDEEQMNVVKDLPQTRKLGMMQCRAAGLTVEKVVAKGYLIEDFAKTYGEPFTRQDNPEGTKAIIDYEYNGTPEAVVYLAHELGHAIADRLQLEEDANRDFVWDGEAENQAYFVQSIFTHFTGFESNESVYHSLSKEEYNSLAKEEREKISYDRIEWYRSAKDKLDNTLPMDSEQRKAAMFSALGADSSSKEKKHLAGSKQENDLSL